MPIENAAPKKFRPERPIYLNTQNTKCKTQDQVLFAVEQLRDKYWLCAYGETSRPFHLSFNNVKELNEFKKDAESLGIKLRDQVIKTDDFGDISDENTEEAPIIPEETKESYEDPDGKVHIS